MSSKRKTRGSMGPLLNGTRDLVTKNMVKVKVLPAFFVSAFTGKTGLQQSQVPQTKGEVWSNEDLPSVEDQARLLLNEPDIHKYTEPDRMPPEVPVGNRELANVTARPHLIIFERSGQLEKIPVDWGWGVK